MEYIEFLRNKMAISHQTGFEINSEEITPTLYPVSYTHLKLPTKQEV